MLNDCVHKLNHKRGSTPLRNRFKKFHSHKVESEWLQRSIYIYLWIPYRISDLFCQYVFTHNCWGKMPTQYRNILVCAKCTVLLQLLADGFFERISLSVRMLVWDWGEWELYVASHLWSIIYFKKHSTERRFPQTLLMTCLLKRRESKTKYTLA